MLGIPLEANNRSPPAIIPEQASAAIPAKPSKIMAQMLALIEHMDQKSFQVLKQNQRLWESLEQHSQA